MAITAEHKSHLADQYAFDSNSNVILFTIEGATEEKIANRFTNSILNHPENYGSWVGSTYTGVAIWTDSAGEVQLSSDCTEVTQ